MDTEVIVVGAGPVGLLLANLLGQQGIRTVVIDKRSSISNSSRAIGITPPSLALLEKLGIFNQFVDAGVKITGAVIHGKKHRLGSISFRSIPSDFKFILSLPQRETEKLLVDNLQKFSTVRLLRRYEVYNYILDRDCAKIQASAVLPDISDNNLVQELQVRGKYLCACDGFRSTLRELSTIKWMGRNCHDTFLMADYIDRTEMGDDAHLFFTPQGSVESFPLPNKKRRWVIQTDTYLADPSEDYLGIQVQERSGYTLALEDKLSQSSFRVYSYMMKRFYSGRMLFLGDAAHTISPIGGQGMNTGFADAGLASYLLSHALEHGKYISLFKIYSSSRRRAASSAAKRAVLSMKTGTIRGYVLSTLRNLILRLILKTPAAAEFPKHFSMLTIPFRDVESVHKEYRRVLKEIGIQSR